MRTGAAGFQVPKRRRTKRSSAAVAAGMSDGHTFTCTTPKLTRGCLHGPEPLVEMGIGLRERHLRLVSFCVLVCATADWTDNQAF